MENHASNYPTHRMEAERDGCGQGFSASYRWCYTETGSPSKGERDGLACMRLPVCFQGKRKHEPPSRNAFGAVAGLVASEQSP